MNMLQMLEKQAEEIHERLSLLEEASKRQDEMIEDILSRLRHSLSIS